MTLKAPVYICLTFLVSLNLSFQWPVVNGRITSTFGEPRYDHFHDGIDIISGNENIYPVADGEMLFFWDRSLFPTENYGGGGNYRVLKHAGGISSVYMHLEDNSGYKGAYTAAEPVGKMGDTGRSLGKHLHFSLLKLNKNISINPLSMLEQIKDDKAPVISEICIKIRDKYYPVKDKCNIRLTRHYPLHIKTIDLINGHERLGVYRLKVSVNDVSVMDAEFSEIVFSGNGLTISKKPYHNLYDENGYYITDGCKYNNGSNKVKVTAVDFSGNSTEKEILFDVKLEVE
jgi:hypothetical protein